MYNICHDVKRDFTIQLTRDGKVFEEHAFNGVKKNAQSAARKLAHENRCGYKLKVKKIGSKA